MDAVKKLVPNDGVLPVDPMILDGSCTQEPTPLAKKPRKRKRDPIVLDSFDRKEACAVEWQQEMDRLFEYFKEFSDHRLNPDEFGCSLNHSSVIACLLEESSLTYAKLVEEIYEKMKLQEGVTLASVRTSVLHVGQRVMYGIPNEDADVLEDGSETCLWCWETRDLKLLPAILRGTLNIRRTARKKIHERILALSANFSALSTSKVLVNQKNESVNLAKVLNLEGIRSLIEKLKQKNDAEMAKKETKIKEKESERNMRNAEKEKRKIDRQVQKEKLQKERELKRLQEDAEKEVKRQERERAELNKQLKKQQEEAEREQKRREKEEAELKKQLSIQKQANMMERFLKSKKSNNDVESSDNKLSAKGPVADVSGQLDQFVSAATSSMDHTFSRADNLALEDLQMSHVAGWRKLSRCDRLCRWGVRQNPKTEVVKELKLQKSSEAAPPESISTPIKEHIPCKDSAVNASFSKLLKKLEVPYLEDIPSINNHDAAPALVRLVKKLLQFDKSHRPAYYGTWSKKSCVVGPRHPFKKDPDLDYDVDSDEEWEEDDPGESLSDCDKDEETMEEENSKLDEEEESEDSFVVPDGYLSEDEGVQIESPCGKVDEISSLPSKPDAEDEEISLLLQKQKVLRNLTEEALRKNRPLMICNLHQEKTGLLRGEELTGMAKLERLCLQALCMWEYPGGPSVDVPVDINPSSTDGELVRSNSKSRSAPIASSQAISDSDLPEFVMVIRSCSHGLNKVVDALQDRFPNNSKKQLKNKVRELADFVDNHWQVKKEILDRLGLSVSPDKGGKPKGIALYFSKRCLPPQDSSNSVVSSPYGSKSAARQDQLDAQVLDVSSQPSVP